MRSVFALVHALIVVLWIAMPVRAQTSTAHAAPSGTLLLPFAPKIEERKSQTDGSSKPKNINEDDPGVNPDQDDQLRGTVQILADYTEYDQDRNTFLGSGHAVAVIAGQNSKLEADTILFDQSSQTIDARGNVKILREGQLSTGSSFKFKVNSDEYLITDLDTELQGTTVVARRARGSNGGLAFTAGEIAMAQPIRFHKNQIYAPISAREEVLERDAHPQDSFPAKPSFRFAARKITYERYKETNNITVTGGRLLMGNFSVPVPTFQTTAGQQNTNVVIPVTPFLSNNLNVGGTNIGPMFNTAVAKNGVFSWAPLVQYGGSKIDGTTVEGQSKLGAGFRVRYTTPKLQTQIAYGSVSNILVAELRYQLRKDVVFQSGINRFTSDGMFGNRRPRAIAEAVHNKSLNKIPFLSYLTFRTSAGWMQDQPALLSLTPEFAELFTDSTSTTVKSGLRVQEQVMFNSHPLLAVGDDRYGLKLSVSGGSAIKGYSTGNAMLLAQAGPVADVQLSRVRLQTGYTQSVVRGSSPFVFDQFIQGQRSTFLGGDLKASKWLTVGGNLGYNLDVKKLYQRSISAAIGPEDFKVIFTRDTMTGVNRFGVDVTYGAPIRYNKLVLKGAPDRGELGGI